MARQRHGSRELLACQAAVARKDAAKKGAIAIALYKGTPAFQHARQMNPFCIAARRGIGAGIRPHSCICDITVYSSRNPFARSASCSCCNYDAENASHVCQPSSGLSISRFIMRPGHPSPAKLALKVPRRTSLWNKLIQLYMLNPASFWQLVHRDAPDLTESFRSLC